MVKTDKKKFLTELGKLLTFMYDEDRATALSMYLEMFEQASNEEELLRFLASPTRQAVMLARQYNAKERNLSVRGIAGEGDSDVAAEKEPRFVRAINDLSVQAEQAGIFSSYVSVWSRNDHKIVSEDSPEKEGPEIEDSEIEGPKIEGPEIERPEIERPEKERVRKKRPDRVRPERVRPEKECVRKERPDRVRPEYNSENIQENTHEERNAQKSGNIPDLVWDTDSDKKPDKNPDKNPDINPDTKRRNGQSDKSDVIPDETPKEKPEQKEANIFRLILYILFAVPVTAALLVLLLVPVVISLSLSVLLIILGVEVIATAFGGFSVFADIMVVLGVAFVLIALGFLVFRLFIWLITTVMVNVVNESIVLGERFSITGGN